MKQIRLSGKYKHIFMLVDDEDSEKVSKYKWYLHYKGYAVRNSRDYNSAHILILGKKEGFVIDHINNNKLDNRKENLRFITNTQNIRRRGVQKNSSTKYKGVYLCKTKGLKKTTIRYQPAIRVNKKLIMLGYFENVYDAVLTYNVASKFYHKEYGYQNELPDKNNSILTEEIVLNKLKEKDGFVKRGEKRKPDNHILTKEIVEKIRKEYKATKTSYNKLSIKYGVSKSTIAAIITHRLWKYPPLLHICLLFYILRI